MSSPRGRQISGDYVNRTKAAKGQIHKFNLNGDRLLLDVNSGSVHEIDEIAWDVFDLYPEFPPEEIVERLRGKYHSEEARAVLAEIDELVEEGLLFSGEEHLEGFRPSADSPLKAVCLHVAHDCNLRCAYCFAQNGPFGGERGLMPPKVARAAVDLLIARSGSRQACEVDFFGGEPLLNFEVVRETVEYAKAKGAAAGKVFSFTLTTNATLLTPEIEDFLNAEDISLILSLDGRPEVNDRMRPLAGGQGSYDLVLDRIRRCVERRKASSTSAYAIVRSTYTRHNRDFSRDVLHLADLGFDALSLEPVVASEEEPYALRDEDIPQLCAEYERLAQAYLERRLEGRPFAFFHFNLDLEGGPCLPRRLTGCGAGYQYLAVTPSGELYPCHQFVGRREFLCGDVFTGPTRPDLTKIFVDSHIFTKEECPTCWARFYCSGGCHANADKFNGDIRRPHRAGCELQKKRLECALWVQGRLREAGV